MDRKVRERVLDEIRAELDRYHPLEQARVPLELIAETSIRLRDGDGPDACQVVDDQGRPRTRVVDGRTVDLTIRDLVAEIRESHPTLFEPAETHPVAAADAGGIAAAPLAGVRAEPVAEPVLRAEPVPKAPDWQIVAEAPAAAADAPAGKAAGPTLKDRLGTKLHLLRGVLPVGRPRPGKATSEFIGPSRTRTLYAAAGVAALAFIGYLSFGPGFHLPGRDSVAHGTTTAAAPAGRKKAEPAATGAVNKTAAQSARPAGTEPADGGLLAGVPEVVDTSTLRVNGRIVRLFGVEWVRGGQPESLARYLRGREVACRPAGPGETHRCEVDGRDLSEVILFNGGGRATADASQELLTAETHARSERLGVWRQ